MTTPMQGTKTRKTPFAREIDQDLESLRDDCIALFINSRLTQQQIHQSGGPTPQTISRWLYKETAFPRYSTISTFLHALGCRMVVVDKAAVVPQQVRTKVTRPSRHRPKMPIRASARRAIKKAPANA